MIEGLSKERRKEVLGAAVDLYKSGADPSPDGVTPDTSRASVRRAERAAGNRGAKTAQKNPARHARSLQAGAQRVRQAVLVDEALHDAKDRVEHPIASRLRGRLGSR